MPTAVGLVTLGTRGSDILKRAFITGITGQDGSYLTELLLSKGYEVHGLIRRSSTINTPRIDHLYQDPHLSGRRLLLHYGDLTDSEQLTNLIYNVRPDEVYHLGAQSHVRVSFDMPQYTGDATGLGTTRILSALHRSGIKARFYQASSSEMFGNAPPPQSERTPFQPRSPYAAAKAYGYWMANNYRDGFGLFICNGILFNHESPRRGETFLTRKVTRAVAGIRARKQEDVHLGSLTPKRDWGYSPEYVEAMWLMLQQDSPDDYVIGTGESNSVSDFVQEAFAYAGMDWREYVRHDPRYLRPTEVDELRADAEKAREKLGWEPKVTFRELVHIMVDADLEAVGLPRIGNGRDILLQKFGPWHQWDSAVSGTLGRGRSSG